MHFVHSNKKAASYIETVDISLQVLLLHLQAQIGEEEEILPNFSESGILWQGK